MLSTCFPPTPHTHADEALALGVRQGASILMAVPCCHQHLHKQLARSSSPPLFDPLMRHGIMRQRFVDLLTDSLRAHLLRMCGYK